MEYNNANEILACLERERTRFYYGRDDYALQLLQYAVGDGARVEVIRKGPFARLLNKPPVRRLLAECGDGWLTRERLATYWEAGALPFLLTVGLWGGGEWRWNQTTRPGYNLVLRLNFVSGHDRRFRQLFAPYHWNGSLNIYHAHPVLRQDERRYYRETLAWARLDVDLENGEALIEEIQTDWIREAADALRELPNCDTCTRRATSARCRQVVGARRYLEEVLAPYRAIWDEAMLSATLHFLREELGVKTIWYHTWESGNALKRINGRAQPPRSLYSRLPGRFCFAPSGQLPTLLDDRRVAKHLRRQRVVPRFQLLQLH